MNTLEENIKCGGEKYDIIIPKTVQIEPIFGCNANCIMCPINKPTKRKKGVMPDKLFRKIVDDIIPYRHKIEHIDLFGLGEPILDKHIFEKIRYLKKKGLRGIGIATNMDLLNKEKQDLLLESGIDTVIISIDSTKKEIHEKIRRGTNFDGVVANTNNLIAKRNKGKFHTKFVIRCIRQELNKDEGEDYKEYWGSRIDRKKGDQIDLYNIQGWGREIPISITRTKEIESLPCYHVFERVFILCDGDVQMCSCNFYYPYVVIGNVEKTNLIDIYNNEKMKEIRRLHLSGKKNTLELCRNCNVLYSREKKEIF